MYFRRIFFVAVHQKNKPNPGIAMHWTKRFSFHQSNYFQLGRSDIIVDVLLGRSIYLWAMPACLPWKATISFKANRQAWLRGRWIYLTVWVAECLLLPYIVLKRKFEPSLTYIYYVFFSNKLTVKSVILLLECNINYSRCRF